MSYRHTQNTSVALIDQLLQTVQKMAAAPRSEHADLAMRLVEVMDDYVDARVEQALDREFNRGDYSRY